MKSSINLKARIIFALLWGQGLLLYGQLPVANAPIGWREVSVFPTAANLHAVRAFPLNGNIEVLVAGQEGNTYRSMNGGTTWNGTDAKGIVVRNNTNFANDRPVQRGITFADVDFIGTAGSTTNPNIIGDMGTNPQVGYAIGQAGSRYAWFFSDGPASYPVANNYEMELYRTNNGGAHWFRPYTFGTNQSFHKPSCPSNMNARYIIESSLIPVSSLKTVIDGDEQKNTNFYNNLSLFYRNTTYGRYPNFNALDFINESDGVIVGNAGLILWTRDGGATWERLPVPINSGTPTTPKWEEFNADYHDIVRIGSKWYIVGTQYSGNDRKPCVVRVEISGNSPHTLTWTIINDGNFSGSTRLTTISFFDDNHGFVAGSGYGGTNECASIFYTTDGGSSWTPVGAFRETVNRANDRMRELKKLVAYFSPSSSDPNIGNGYALLVGEGGFILRATFTNRNNILSGKATCQDYLNSSSSNYFWQQIDAGTQEFFYDIDFSPANNSTEARNNINSYVGYIVGSYGTILKSTNGGVSWQNISQRTDPSQPEAWLNAVAFDPTAATTANAHGIAVGDNGFVKISEDGGQTWRRRTIPGTETLLDVQMLDAEFAIAVGERGAIYRTFNHGLQWQKIVRPASAANPIGGNNWTNKTLRGVALWLEPVGTATKRYGVIVGDRGTILNATNGDDCLTWNLIDPAVLEVQLRGGMATPANNVNPYTYPNFTDVAVAVASINQSTTFWIVAVSKAYKLPPSSTAITRYSSVFRSNNRGFNWVPVVNREGINTNLAPQDSFDLYGITFLPNSERGYAVGRQFVGDYKSRNDFAKDNFWFPDWTPSGGQNQQSLRTLSNNVYAGVVMRTNTAGLAWLGKDGSFRAPIPYRPVSFYEDEYRVSKTNDISQCFYAVDAKRINGIDHVLITGANGMGLRGVTSGGKTTWHPTRSEINTRWQASNTQTVCDNCGDYSPLHLQMQTQWQLHGVSYISHITNDEEAVAVGEKGSILRTVRGGLYFTKPNTEEESPRIVQSAHGFSVEAFPNPFAQTATINLDIQEGASMDIAVYDALGRRIQEIQQGTVPKGKHSYTINGQDLPDGAYYCKISSGESTLTIPLVLVK